MCSDVIFFFFFLLHPVVDKFVYVTVEVKLKNLPLNTHRQYVKCNGEIEKKLVIYIPINSKLRVERNEP